MKEMIEGLIQIQGKIQFCKPPWDTHTHNVYLLSYRQSRSHCLPQKQLFLTWRIPPEIQAQLAIAHWEAIKNCKSSQYHSSGARRRILVGSTR
ncbi:hypothetical protein CDAR_204701 [Caerostris darwini]|uniref:Uncharacterized protein n=1 Tax=Caerostris darwini TaxID=1538125 RepID=A0AAV4UXC7_9ARAC|nr:hypothetical protein CDAR_204701 [Caerostris darwini]